LARYREAVCRLCRREGIKLFLKGERCFSDKCAIEKRNFPPGQHGSGRRPKSKLVGYGLQLREKQRTKRVYGVLERQFRNYFDKAERQKGVTGENLLYQLERRLDTVAHRLGLASSRAHARQLVLHGHVRVNGRKINIPSYLVNTGDEISLKEGLHQNVEAMRARDLAQGRSVPSWLEVDRQHFKGRVLGLPKREEIVTPPIQEQLIVELYSR